MVVSLAGWGTPVTLFWSSVAGVTTEPACSAVGRGGQLGASRRGHGAVICAALGVVRASSARFVHRVQREQRMPRVLDGGGGPRRLCSLQEKKTGGESA